MRSVDGYLSRILPLQMSLRKIILKSQFLAFNCAGVDSAGCSVPPAPEGPPEGVCGTPEGGAGTDPVPTGGVPKRLSMIVLGCLNTF